MIITSDIHGIIWGEPELTMWISARQKESLRNRHEKSFSLTHSQTLAVGYCLYNYIAFRSHLASLFLCLYDR